MKLEGAGQRLALGDRVWLVPGHCDPTINLYDWYVAVRGGRVEAHLADHRARRGPGERAAPAHPVDCRAAGGVARGRGRAGRSSWCTARADPRSSGRGSSTSLADVAQLSAPDLPGHGPFRRPRENPREGQRLIQDLSFAAGAPPECVELVDRVLRAGAPLVTLADYLACDRFDVRERLAAIRTPTLVLAGAEDRLTPPAYGRFLAETIPGARLVEIPAVGHFPQLEQPHTVNAAIREFLTRLGDPVRRGGGRGLAPQDAVTPPPAIARA